jgi:hypothetical protein
MGTGFMIIPSFVNFELIRRLARCLILIRIEKLLIELYILRRKFADRGTVR